jgi:multidrug resistance protein, MATE family
MSAPQANNAAAPATTTAAATPMTISSSARQIVRLGLPVMVAQLAVMANGVIDTVMAGHLSARALAVVGLGSSVFFSIFVTLMGVILALTPIVSQHFGAGEHTRITHAARQGLWLAALVSIGAVLLLMFPAPFFKLARMQPELEAEVRQYLFVCTLAAPAMLLFRVFTSLATAISRPRAVMMVQLIGLVLKVPLNLLFMHGELSLGFIHLRLPGGGLGGVGCAWALVVEYWLLAAVACVWMSRGEAFARYRIFARFEAINWRTQGEMVRLGAPIGAAFMIDVTSYTFMALFIARLGENTSAAHQIAANLGAFAYMVPLAVSTATSVLVGQAIGAGRLEDARLAGISGMVVGLGLALTLSAVIGLGASSFASLYTSNTQVIALAAPLIMLAGGFHIFDAMNAVASMAVRGYKKAVVPMLVFAFALWVVGLGGGYLLAYTDTLGAARGARGFWMGAIIGMALAAITVTFYFFRVADKAIRAAENARGNT